MAELPDYLKAAKPVPQDARAAWYTNTAQTYAGIMLWFVFWHEMVKLDGSVIGGSLACGVGVALFALLVAALFCHFLTYLVPALLGMKTGLPLYVVGTSTYGVRGGFIMPGFLMGVLQFGWLAVNAFFSCYLICDSFKIGVDASDKVIIPGPIHGIMTIVFILLAVVVGLAGIKYVAKVATYVPLIPLAVLLILFCATVGGLDKFDRHQMISANKDAAQKSATDKALALATLEEEVGKSPTADATKKINAAKADVKAAQNLATSNPLNILQVFLAISAYVVGFFATAGAAGVDFGMNNRDEKDVQLGGLVGIVGATFLAGAFSILIVAGAYGSGLVSGAELNPIGMMDQILGTKVVMGLTPAAWLKFMLAIACFAPACFPAFIAANSFKTTMPKFGMVAVGIGTLASIGLAVSGLAQNAVAVFLVVGASFGPICGAMMADYMLAGGKWAGPRAGFNLAGWISWAAGFYLGACDLLAAKVPALACLHLGVPCPPMAALIVGFLLYLILAKLGLQGETLEMPTGEEPASDAAEEGAEPEGA